MTSRGILFPRLLLALALVPLATGSVVVTYRDAIATHLPARHVLAEQLRAGKIPFINPAASCGEPLAGNPNFEAFFPDTFFLYFLPLPAAFGLHFALSFALAFLGARRWARATGGSRGASEVAAASFALSGLFLSAWLFYNAGMALAVGTWVLAAARKLSLRPFGFRRRAVLELALWSALEILAGEPVIALLVFILAALSTLTSAGSGAGDEKAIRPWTMARIAAPTAASLFLAALLAAPQIVTAWQITRGASRDLAPYSFSAATAESFSPIRLVEQLIPFPHGRPDRIGPEGFSGHREFGGHAPYLWTLHFGWAPLTLLLLFCRPGARGEKFWAGAIGVAAVLSLGNHLPGSHWLYRFLSLGGKIRYPIKWWYVIGLALVPLVTRAAERWEKGERPAAWRRRWFFVSAAGAIVVTLFFPWTSLTMVAQVTSVVTAAVLVWQSGIETERSVRLPLWSTCGALFLCALPLLLAGIDRPPVPAGRDGNGRIFEQIQVVLHPPASPLQLESSPFHDQTRRAAPEMWSLTGALSGARYAFDHDPDGSYSYFDRVMREGTLAANWPDRAAELRIAGVDRVIANGQLALPFRSMKILDARNDVRLYSLDLPAPAVRFATRIFKSPHFNGTLDLHRRSDFNPETDTVLAGSGFELPAARDESPRANLRDIQETPSRLIVLVDAPYDGILIWTQTYFHAWIGLVDGVPRRTLLVDGHLVGVPVAAGSHVVEIRWNALPLFSAAAVSLLVSIVALTLYFKSASSEKFVLSEKIGSPFHKIQKTKMTPPPGRGIDKSSMEP